MGCDPIRAGTGFPGRGSREAGGDRRQLGALCRADLLRRRPRHDLSGGDEGRIGFALQASRRSRMPSPAKIWRYNQQEQAWQPILNGILKRQKPTCKNIRLVSKKPARYLPIHNSSLFWMKNIRRMKKGISPLGCRTKTVS